MLRVQHVNNGVLPLSLWACFCMIVIVLFCWFCSREKKKAKMNEREKW